MPVDRVRTVPGLLYEAARRYPGRPAVSDEGGGWTYGELAGHSNAAAHWWTLRGVRPGDRVLLRLTGGRDFAALLYGALRVGAVVVPVNPATGPFHLDWILRDAEPALMVTDGPTAAPVPTAGPTQWRSAGPAPPPATGPAAGDLALLMYTSGSTALPRAVMCPHERVCFAAAAIADRLGYTDDDVVLCRIPISFDYGLYQLFLCALGGAALVLRPDLPEAAILRQVRETGATVVPLVPTLTEIALRLAGRDRGPTRVRLLTNTGASLTGGHAAGLRAAFPAASVVAMYGMTECKRITIAEPGEHLRHPGTVGRPLSGTGVAVVDPAGRPLPAGEVGEIHVRGPHVMAGYWRSTDATGERFDGPASAARRLRTGDYGYLDKAGRLYFVGRRDDIFKRRGVRISTHELEAVILDVTGVEAAAVLAPDADGELVVVVAGPVRPTDVLAAVGARLDPARRPDRCVVVERLPTTLNGKLDRQAARRLCGNGGSR
jgi:acyl-CoA synthetase (AMP-forming)/AMP-acid ligase II